MSFRLPAMPVFRCQARRWISGIVTRLAPIPISAQAWEECRPVGERRPAEECHRAEERRLMEECRLWVVEILTRQDRNFCAGIKLPTATDRSSSRPSIQAIM